MKNPTRLTEAAKREKSLTADEWRKVAEASGHLTKTLETDTHTIYEADNGSVAVVSNAEKGHAEQHAIRKAFIRCGFLLLTLLVIAVVVWPWIG